MTYPFENLVFEGEGVKELAFCGALNVMEQKGIMTNVKRLAGNSAGAITAGLLACGWTSNAIMQELKLKGFNELRMTTLASFVMSNV
jgi:NTE family protein